MRGLFPNMEVGIQKSREEVIEAIAKETESFEPVVVSELVMQDLMVVVRGQEVLRSKLRVLSLSSVRSFAGHVT